MAFIVLDAGQAALVRGYSPTHAYAAIDPRPTGTGFCVNDGVLNDPAHADVVGLLAGLSTVALPTWSGSSAGYKSAGVRDINPASVALSADTILFHGAEGTPIADFVPDRGAINSAELLDDAGGRVKLNGTTGLVVGATKPDFGVTGNPFGTVSYSEVHHWLDVTVSFNGGALEQTYRLRPRFPKIWPTGGNQPGATEITVSNLAELRAEMETPTTDPRIIRFDPSVATVLETNSTFRDLIRVDGKKNFTLIGHRRVIMAKDGGFNIVNAENAVFINIAMRVGADPNGMERSNRDNFILRYGFDVALINCDISWSIDENGSVIRMPSSGGFPDGLPLPTRFLAYRCGIYEPLRSAGHSAGENFHPMGLLFYTGSLQCWSIECVYINNAMRNPYISTKGSAVVQNCLISHFGTSGGYGGTGFNSTSGSVEHNNRTAAVIQGNLYRAGGNPDSRTSAIMLTRIGNGGDIYIAPMSDQNANHHFYWDADQQKHDLSPSDPVDPSGIRLHNGSTLGSIVSEPPFEIEGLPCRPTDTSEARQALYDHLVGEFDSVVGVREFNGDPLDNDPVPGWLAMSRIGHDVFKKFVETGASTSHTGGYLIAPPDGTYVLEDDTVKDLYDTSLPV